MKFQRLSLLACLLVPVVGAAEISASDTIVVTATRTETPISDAIVPVTVISRDDIELSGATDLAELLRFQAGIDIGRNGGPGQATSVFLRGTESNHTLVLVDGVRMNPGTIGGGAIQHITPEIIERVEIVKGARSALFGTDAIGGVINIITRRPQGTEAQFGAGGGSFGSQSAFASAGHRGGGSEIGITVDWADTDGYSPLKAVDIDRGYDNLSVSVFGSRAIGSATVTARHWSASGNVEYLDFFGNPIDQDFRNSTTAVEWQQRVSEAGRSKLIVSYIQDEIDQNQVADFVHSDRMSLDWQYSHALDNHTLTAGIFLMDETAETLSFGSGFDEDTDVRALFVQDQWSRDKHRAFAAIRFSDHETYGNETTWNVEYAYDLSGSLTASIGAGHAFRAPDATDRFGFGGNVNLKPEVADEIQAGIRYRPASRHSIDFELYSNDIEDLIGFDETFTAVNVAEAEIRGAQLGYEYTGDTFTFRSEFVRQTAEDKATGSRLLRRAEETLAMSYTQSIGEHRLGLSVLASGDREDFGGTSLAGYVLANLTGQIRLGDKLRLNARLENLLDTDYETAAGFRMQERSAFVELRYSWK
ncbi:MAG: TonB-dependent receptor [Woeseiaceae bacterium]|nr:TonB-dependent receptor [Woeseiaceae bacterium]